MAEPETEAVETPQDDAPQDTEITLGTGKLLVAFFGLAVVCAIFFTLGFMLGRSNGSGGRTEVVTTTPSGGNVAGKPSAANKSSDTTAQPCLAGTPNCPAVAGTDTSVAAVKKSDSQPVADTTKPVDTSAAKPTDASAGTPGSFIVQVAAVSKKEDAEILVAALSKKQYPVFVASNVPGDALFHVQVGPFTDRKEADAMRNRLANDGYNAIVK
ncbi:MAG TPA: SPOR domain-containing protein [Alphaproteobacteria bacterium]|nr:SPOR domain-containing protein [Alphaproteobacteria bacterium]